MRESSAEQRVLVRAAVLYYREGATQAEVAHQLGVSRATAGRMLVRARETGLVRIEIASPLTRQIEVEIALEKRFGLVEAVVVEPVVPGDHPGVELGLACADLLMRRLRSGMVLGLGWQSDPRDPIAHTGEALRPMVSAGTRPANVTVAQLAGSLPDGAARRNPGRSIADVAGALGAQERLIPAPLFVDDPVTVTTLMSDSTVREALAAAGKSDVCLFGVGDVTETTPLFVNGYLDSGALTDLRTLGAVGDIAGRFFDADGRPVDGALARRTVGVTLDTIANSPLRIATAAGPARVAALRAAFTGDLANILVTDVATATGLLETD